MNAFPILEVQSIVDDLSPDAIAVLDQLGPEDDFGYFSFKELERLLPVTREQVRAAMAELRKHDLVTFARGLMTEDGEMAWSGYARNDAGQRLMDTFEAIQTALETIESRRAALAREPLAELSGNIDA